MNNLALGSNADAEEKSALGTVAALMPDLTSFVVGAMILFSGMGYRIIIVSTMGGPLMGGPISSALAVMLTEADQIEARGNNAIWTSGNDGHLQLLLSLWCLLGAAWCWYLPTWAKNWLAKLELDTETVNAVSRTWIRIYFCYTLPLIQMGCAFKSYQDSGSMIPGIVRSLSFVILVPLLLLQTDENILRIRRMVLVTRLGSMIGWSIVYQVDLTLGRSVVFYETLVRWHLCSGVTYNSVIDHLQDSLLILAAVLATGPSRFIDVLGVTMASIVAICIKLMWYQFNPEN